FLTQTPTTHIYTLSLHDALPIWLVVAPGFIDLHSHGQDSVNYKFLAHDGVTTALELELGTYPVAPWYAKREGKSLINFGVSASQDRKSTRLNSSHLVISYAVFCF